MDELLEGVRGLSIMRHALKAEIQALGHGDALEQMGTLKTFLRDSIASGATCLEALEQPDTLGEFLRGSLAAGTAPSEPGAAFPAALVKCDSPQGVRQSLGMAAPHGHGIAQQSGAAEAVSSSQRAPAAGVVRAAGLRQSESKAHPSAAAASSPSDAKAVSGSQPSHHDKPQAANSATKSAFPGLRQSQEAAPAAAAAHSPPATDVKSVPPSALRQSVARQVEAAAPSAAPQAPATAALRQSQPTSVRSSQHSVRFMPTHQSNNSPPHQVQQQQPTPGPALAANSQSPPGMPSTASAAHRSPSPTGGVTKAATPGYARMQQQQQQQAVRASSPAGPAAQLRSSYASPPAAQLRSSQAHARSVSAALHAAPYPIVSSPISPSLSDASSSHGAPSASPPRHSPGVADASAVSNIIDTLGSPSLPSPASGRSPVGYGARMSMDTTPGASPSGEASNLELSLCFQPAAAPLDESVALPAFLAANKAAPGPSNPPPAEAAKPPGMQPNSAAAGSPDRPTASQPDQQPSSSSNGQSQPAEHASSVPQPAAGPASPPEHPSQRTAAVPPPQNLDQPPHAGAAASSAPAAGSPTAAPAAPATSAAAAVRQSRDTHPAERPPPHTPVHAPAADNADASPSPSAEHTPAPASSAKGSVYCGTESELGSRASPPAQSVSSPGSVNQRQSSSPNPHWDSPNGGALHSQSAATNELAHEHYNEGATPAYPAAHGMYPPEMHHYPGPQPPPQPQPLQWSVPMHSNGSVRPRAQHPNGGGYPVPPASGTPPPHMMHMYPNAPQWPPAAAGHPSYPPPQPAFHAPPSKIPSFASSPRPQQQSHGAPPPFAAAAAPPGRQQAKSPTPPRVQPKSPRTASAGAAGGYAARAGSTAEPRSPTPSKGVPAAAEKVFLK